MNFGQFLKSRHTFVQPEDDSKEIRSGTLNGSFSVTFSNAESLEQVTRAIQESLKKIERKGWEPQEHIAFNLTCGDHGTIKVETDFEAKL